MRAKLGGPGLRRGDGYWLFISDGYSAFVTFTSRAST